MENNIQTVIGDEIEVTVYFDYEPEQQQTHWDPGFTSQIEINAVCVDGNEERNIAEVLSREILRHLELKCFEYMESEE